MERKLNLMKHLKKKKVGLVLGSGSAKGLAHIGVIKLLEEMDIKIDVIAGTSIGALIGGIYTTGISIEEIEDIALKIDLATSVKFFFPTIPKSGLISGLKVKEFLISLIGDKKIENLKIPFSAVATDIITGHEVIFNEGNLVDAIRASISIPIIFKPVIHNDIILVDGGIANPLPIDVVRKMGAEFIIAVNVMPSLNKTSKVDNYYDSQNSSHLPEIKSILQRKLEELSIDHKWLKKFLTHKEKQDMPGLKKIFNQSVHIAEQKLIELSIKLYKPDILIEPNITFAGRFDFYKAKEIIEKGYKSAHATFNKNK